MKDDEALTAQLQVRLPPSLNRKLDAKARAAAIDRATYVRRLIMMDTNMPRLNVHPLRRNEYLTRSDLVASALHGSAYVQFEVLRYLDPRATAMEVRVYHRSERGEWLGPLTERARHTYSYLEHVNDYVFVTPGGAWEVTRVLPFSYGDRSVYHLIVTAVEQHAGAGVAAGG